jgi:hypothetical protein
MINSTTGGLQFKYILVAFDANGKETIVAQKMARYPVVSEAIKLHKQSRKFEIRALGPDGKYTRDAIGMDQSTGGRPPVKGRPAAPVAKRVELINAMSILSEASLALAAMERKGTLEPSAVNEWAQNAMLAFRHAGFNDAQMREIVGNAFPRQNPAPAPTTPAPTTLPPTQTPTGDSAKPQAPAPITRNVPTNR